MSGRIRSIKPESLKDEELWDAEAQTGLPLFRAFVGLWCQADRRGRFEWRPRMLKSEVLPYWDGDFEHVLDALVTRGFLVRYTVEGREYGWLPTFEKHQWINGKEPESKLPPPPENVVGPTGSRVGHVSNTREGHEPHAPIQIPSRSDPDPAPDQGGAGGAAPSALPTPLQAKAQLLLDNPTDAVMAHGSPETWPEVIEAFGRLKAVYPALGQLRSRDARARTIVERFAEGTTLDQLDRSARGSKLDPHIAGNAAYQTVQTVWRDAGQVDKFCALLEAPPTARGPKAARPTDDPSFDLGKHRAARLAANGDPNGEDD